MSTISAFTGRVVIMYSCPLTLMGLQRFLSRLLPRATLLCVNSLAALRNDPQVPQADFIISDLHDAQEKAESGIAWLTWLQLIRSGRPLLVLTDDEELPELTLLLESPDVSFISLRERQHVLSELIGNVLAGSRVVHQQTQRSARREPQQALTAAEQQVYQLLQKGYGVTQIAQQLCRSVKTVSTHKRRVMVKLDAHSEVELFSRSAAEKAKCCPDYSASSSKRMWTRISRRRKSG